MSLFPSANDFKAGPGVEKDAPRKTGVGRFFELVGRDMSSMFLANLLTCLGFLPVICLVYIGFLMNSLPVMLVSAAAGGILAGPALAGMYDTVLRALRDEAGYWWTTYRKAFKRNFKASILPGVLYCVVVTVQIFFVYFCFNMLYHGTNVGVPMWVATVLNLLLLHMLFSYLWPQVVLLDQPLFQTLKNSVNCMIAFLPHALAASWSFWIFSSMWNTRSRSPYTIWQQTSTWNQKPNTSMSSRPSGIQRMTRPQNSTVTRDAASAWGRKAIMQLTLFLSVWPKGWSSRTTWGHM